MNKFIDRIKITEIFVDLCVARNTYLIPIYSILFLIACNEQPEITPPINPNIEPEQETIFQQLSTQYTQLPEQAITVSLDTSVYAQYAMPTEKYRHGILGDQIEAEQLVVVVDSQHYALRLQDEYVFEDIRPRLYDVDGDKELEIITIRTHVSQGAGIAIYKIRNEALVEYAHVPEIGAGNRWLNIVAIHDLDQDGTVELAWIQTPHIGGILKVANIGEGTLEVLSEKSQYSNHAIGERNLCLSVLTEQAGQRIVYVPTQNRTQIAGFIFKDNAWNQVETITQTVDFSQTLMSQYSFINPILDDINCIK